MFRLTVRPGQNGTVYPGDTWKNYRLAALRDQVQRAEAAALRALQGRGAKRRAKGSMAPVVEAKVEAKAKNGQMDLKTLCSKSKSKKPKPSWVTAAVSKYVGKPEAQAQEQDDHDDRQVEQVPLPGVADEACPVGQVGQAPNKEKRKLQKKLREIEQLKGEDPDALRSDQKRKIQKEQSLKAQLEDLG